MPELPLSLALCLDIVIDSTGHRAQYVALGSDPDKTLLRELGVFSSTEAEDLKATIQFMLRGNYQIKQADITADPTATVAICAISVKSHAH